MHWNIPIWRIGSLVASALVLAGITSASWAQEEFDETKVLIEINATDGDAGFHVLLDADAWRAVRIDDPKGKKIFQEEAKGNLLDQGLTENFFESAEPLCAADEEDPEAEVVPLSEFLRRFPAGEYLFTGKTTEGDKLEGTAELTHALPAAPQILVFDGTIITWMKGSDLGKCQDNALVAEGAIPDPANVEVVGWEVVVEPEDDEAVDPLRVFSVQLPPTIMSVTVPSEFVNSYLADGVTAFKVEVGAIEESGNQTFSEKVFDLAEEP